MSNMETLPGDDPLALCARQSFWAAARERDTVIRALKVASIVGLILVLINQADLLLAGDFPPLWKVLLTFCVPYSVSTYSVASFKVMQRSQ